MKLAQDEGPAQTDSQECAPFTVSLDIGVSIDQLTTDPRMSSSLTGLVKAIQAREISPVEVAQMYLDRMERLNPSSNALVTVAPDVLDRARAAEAALMRGEACGALHGVPITVKDTIETAGLRTTSCSVICADH